MNKRDTEDADRVVTILENPNAHTVQDLKQMKYEKAIAFLNKALDFRISLLGESHTAVADSHRRLAFIHTNNAQKYHEALQELKKAHEIFEALVGGDDPRTLQTARDIETVKGFWDKRVQRFFEKKFWHKNPRLNNTKLEISSNALARKLSNSPSKPAVVIAAPAHASKKREASASAVKGILDTLGVSVHYLQNQFMSEIKEAGYDEDSKIYEIENLRGPPGVIRHKGLDVVSPIDGEKGASYIHCLDGEDAVGNSTFMLSYGWGYTIGDIVTTLRDYCSSNGLDPKRTYIWICCLCVNQHRVVEQEERKRSGILVPAVDFFAEFRERVVGIGHILSMFMPWDDPLYLKRVWCVFEIYMAHEHGCQVTIVMPPTEKKAFREALFRKDKETSIIDTIYNSIANGTGPIDEANRGMVMEALERHNASKGNGTSSIDSLYEALSRTKVEKAEASVEDDRLQILAMVEKGPGYATFNRRINELLRKWAKDTVCSMMTILGEEAERGNLSQKSYATMCLDVHAFFRRNGEYDASTEMIHKFKDAHKLIAEEDVKQNWKDTASECNNMGHLLTVEGDFDAALAKYYAALSLTESNLGDQHADTATCHYNVGCVLTKKGDHIGALNEHLNALEIRKSLFGSDHLSIAASYNNIGDALYHQNDNDGALDYYRKALTIHEAKLSKEHPLVATSYNNVGHVLQQMGDYERSQSAHEKALAIRRTILGENHEDTAASYNNLGLLLSKTGNEDAAMENYLNALAIFESVLGPNHLSTACSRCNIGCALFKKEDYSGAVSQLTSAHAVFQSKLGKRHPRTRSTGFSLLKARIEARKQHIKAQIEAGKQQKSGTS